MSVIIVIFYKGKQYTYLVREVEIPLTGFYISFNDKEYHGKAELIRVEDI